MTISIADQRTVTLPTHQGPMRVSVIAEFGPLIVHRDVLGWGYRVTYEPTGRAMGELWDSRSGAIRAARRLSKLDIDWPQFAVWSALVRDALDGKP